MAEIAYCNEKELPPAHNVSICELLDRVLNKGAVLTGELTISVADIELLYVGLNIVVSSVETLIHKMEWSSADMQTQEDRIASSHLVSL